MGRWDYWYPDRITLAPGVPISLCTISCDTRAVEAITLDSTKESNNGVTLSWMEFTEAKVKWISMESGILARSSKLLDRT